MKVLVLGGCGIQGRAALYDLSRNPGIKEVISADIQPGLIHSFSFLDTAKIKSVSLNASDSNALTSIMEDSFDVVLDFLPPQYIRSVAEAAISRGIHLVNTNYPYDIHDLDQAAKQKGIIIIPECGLDPGIDLILYNYSRACFDEISKLNSYCGGIPDKAACDNPINYKISWNINAVLRSQVRDATLISGSKMIHITSSDQHDNPFIHNIEFPGIGILEAIPNGNAVHYADVLNLRDHLTDTGRYTLRWPGWCSFWAPLKKLGFLRDEPIKDLPVKISPLELVAKLLEPQLQYKDGEKDLCVMVNIIEGIRMGKHQKMICSMVIERDSATGLMAMSMGVAYPSCIAAEMIVNGEIEKRGVLSPAVDVPCDLFLDRLATKGIKIVESIENME